MKAQLARIQHKLQLLRSLDPDLKLFGAETHKYQLHPTLTTAQVAQFEEAHQVSLPEDYVAFLLHLGDGGAGPFYGMHRLEESRINFWDNSGKGNHTYFNLSKPFPHRQSWNAEAALEALYAEIEVAYEAGNTELETALLEKKWILIGGEEHDFGRLNIADFGCGVWLSLIVSGAESGNMWTDDRTNDAGLYPTTEGGKSGAYYLSGLVRIMARQFAPGSWGRVTKQATVKSPQWAIEAISI